MDRQRQQTVALTLICMNKNSVVILDENYMNMGVPQRSVLGLALLYVNHIDPVVITYADDFSIVLYGSDNRSIIHNCTDSLKQVISFFNILKLFKNYSKKYVFLLHNIQNKC